MSEEDSTTEGGLPASASPGSPHQPMLRVRLYCPDGMRPIETSVTIARPPEEVFAYLTDLHNAKDWNTEVIDVKYER